MPIVDVVGVGKVEFPDDMSQEQIRDVLQKKFGGPKESAEPMAAEPQQQPSMVERLGRQAGLAGRYAIEGPAETLGILTEPIRAGLNTIPGVDLRASASDTGTMIADELGLPSPEGKTERVVGEASRLLTGATPIAGGAQAASKVATGTTKNVLSRVAAAPGVQGVSAGTAGASGGYVREEGGGPAEQFGASLLGGLTGAGAASLTQRLYSSAKGLVSGLRGASDVTNADISSRVNKMLKNSGISLKEVPASVRNELTKEVRKATRTGKEVNPEVVRRIADYGYVGATPTRGTATLDPAQITQERNLAKIGMNSSDKRLQRLGQIQRENDLALMESLNKLSAGQGDDAASAGTQIIRSLRDMDAPRKEAVDVAYKAVRDSKGRYAQLDTAEFSRLANNALDEKMLGSALPDKSLRLLNDVSTGKIPLNVNTMTQLDKRLSGQARDAIRKGDSESALAINQIRTALRDTPVESTSGQDTIDLYNRARQLAAERFSLIDRTPALKAALDDMAPDKFVQTFITGSGNKANIRDVETLATELSKSPQAFQTARQQIIGFLRDKALSGAPEEVANFSPSGYRRAIRNIGDKKLSMFFDDAEVKQLKTIGRVAAYDKFQPTGSAVNNSNTGSAVAGLLERIAGNRLIGGLPFGEAAIAAPARNTAAQLQARQAANPAGAIAAPAAEQGRAVVPYATLPALTTQTNSR